MRKTIKAIEIHRHFWVTTLDNKEIHIQFKGCSFNTKHPMLLNGKLTIYADGFKTYFDYIDFEILQGIDKSIIDYLKEVDKLDYQMGMTIEPILKLLIDHYKAYQKMY